MFAHQDATTTAGACEQDVSAQNPSSARESYDEPAQNGALFGRQRKPSGKFERPTSLIERGHFCYDDIREDRRDRKIVDLNSDRRRRLRLAGNI
jgi:hypothetical protein